MYKKITDQTGLSVHKKSDLNPDSLKLSTCEKN